MLMPMLMLPVLDVWPGRRPEGHHFAKGRVYAFLDSLPARPAPRATKASSRGHPPGGVLQATSSTGHPPGGTPQRTSPKGHTPGDILQGASSRGHPPDDILQGTSSENPRQRTAPRGHPQGTSASGHPPGDILHGTSRGRPPGFISRGHPPGAILQGTSCRGHPPADILQMVPEDVPWGRGHLRTRPPRAIGRGAGGPPGKGELLANCEVGRRLIHGIRFRRGGHFSRNPAAPSCTPPLLSPSSSPFSGRASRPTPRMLPPRSENCLSFPLAKYCPPTD